MWASMHLLNKDQKNYIRERKEWGGGSYILQMVSAMVEFLNF